MTNYLETSDSNFGELIEQFPLRLEYLKKLKKDRNLSRSKKILLALSQKQNKDILNFFSKLSFLKSLIKLTK